MQHSARASNTFNCERCGTEIVTTEDHVVCPECGDHWYCFCRYCEIPLSNVFDMIEGACSECVDPNQGYLDKIEDKQNELDWENQCMADALVMTAQNFVLNKDEQHWFDRYQDMLQYTECNHRTKWIEQQAFPIPKINASSSQKIDEYIDADEDEIIIEEIELSDSLF